MTRSRTSKLRKSSPTCRRPLPVPGKRCGRSMATIDGEVLPEGFCCLFRIVMHDCRDSGFAFGFASCSLAETSVLILIGQLLEDKSSLSAMYCSIVDQSQLALPSGATPAPVTKNLTATSAHWKIRPTHEKRWFAGINARLAADIAEGCLWRQALSPLSPWRCIPFGTPVR